MTKSRILLCLGDFPFPARKNGYSIRYFPIIEHFSKFFEIDLFVQTSYPFAKEELQLADDYCNKVVVCQRQSLKVGILTKIYKRLLSFCPGATPFDCIYYDQADINTLFKQNFSGVHYPLIVAASITTIDMIQKFCSFDRLTLDVIDSPYALKSRVAKSPLDKYDAWLMRVWERKTLRSVDAASYISPLDKLMACGLASWASKVEVIPNGVFLSDFAGEAQNYAAPTIGYLGHMGYPPNIKAAVRLYHIFKKVQETIPELKLVIIGRSPVAEISKLSQDSSVVITGTVDNIWPYVKGVDLFVFPMLTGSGQQNKLLEAMAASKAVISTELGNSGVGAVNNNTIVLANSDEDICASIVSLMSNPDKRLTLAANGYDFVMKKYSWAGVFDLLSRSLFRLKS